MIGKFKLAVGDVISIRGEGSGVHIQSINFLYFFFNCNYTLLGGKTSRRKLVADYKVKLNSCYEIVLTETSRVSVT